MKLELYKQVQFIYELVMAERELKAAGIDHTLNSDRHSVDVGEPFDREFILRRSAYFEAVNGHPTDYAVLQEYNQTSSVNQYLTHWFYPYKGKFHPQVIRGLLNIIDVKQGDKVLDPFLGSGTAALEAQLVGARAVGVDISPLCCLISRVKTRSWRHVEELDEATQVLLPDMLEHAARIQNRVEDVKSIPYDELAPPHKLDGVTPSPVQDFARLAWLIAVSDLSRRKRDISKALRNNWAKMVKSVKAHDAVRRELGLTYHNPEIREGDARALPLDDDSIDGIITSPPYSLALNYLRNDQHALEAMGLSLDEMEPDFIGVRGRGMEERFSLYDEDMRDSVREMVRVLKPGGKCAIIIGDKVYKGEEVPTSETVQRWLEASGMDRDDVIPKTIFGLYNVMQDEDILIYKKPEA